MICVSCQTKMDPYFMKKSFQIMRCPVCKLMAVENAPEDLSPYYSEGYFTGDVTLDGYMDYELDKEVTKRTYTHYLDLIERSIGKSAGVSMFEAGCATGFFLKLAKERGWEVEGNDLSAYAIEKAKEKGLHVHLGSLETLINNKQYEAVVMYDLIEHVKDPVITLAKATSMIKSGGVFVITTPDAGSIWARVMGKRWHAFVPPQHLFYFSRKNLEKLLKVQGFEIFYPQHSGKSFTIPYIFRLLYSWTGLCICSIIAEKLSQSFFNKIAIPINVGDTIFLIAKKI